MLWNEKGLDHKDPQGNLCGDPRGVELDLVNRVCVVDHGILFLRLLHLHPDVREHFGNSPARMGILGILGINHLPHPHVFRLHLAERRKTPPRLRSLVCQSSSLPDRANMTDIEKAERYDVHSTGGVSKGGTQQKNTIHSRFFVLFIFPSLLRGVGVSTVCLI